MTEICADDTHLALSKEDVLAFDWEISDKKIELNAQQITDAFWATFNDMGEPKSFADIISTTLQNLGFK